MRTLNLDLENISFKQRLHHLYYEHLLAASLGWQRLFRQSYQTAGAIILIGLALSVCLIFGLTLRITQHFQAELEHTSSITIFPNTEIPHASYQDLLERLKNQQDLQNLKIYSAGDLVEELLDKNIAQSFWENIPGVITASSPKNFSVNEILQLKKELEQDPSIIAVEFDQFWHSKIMRLISFAHILSWIVGGVLVSTVVLMVNYSIKLLMEKYKQEISVLYHLGASSHFIQRPYLYQGFFLGCFGSLFAPLCLGIPLFLLREQIFSLLDLYDVTLNISQQDLFFLFYILIGVVAFAWICSYSSTKKWLRMFELEFI